jgi:hypothetical protein
LPKQSQNQHIGVALLDSIGIVFRITIRNR